LFVRYVVARIDSLRLIENRTVKDLTKENENKNDTDEHYLFFIVPRNRYFIIHAILLFMMYLYWCLSLISTNNHLS